MKTLLRTSILAVLVFAGYSAFSTPVDNSQGNVGRPPIGSPCGPEVPGGACAK
jgi:hypothetical protein